MPEHFRSLIVILLLTTVVFAVSRGPMCAAGIAPSAFNRRRNLWLAITLAAFFAHNFWVYIVVVGWLLLSAAKKEQNIVALYFSVFLAIPPLKAEIPGFGVLNYLFTIDYYRLLAVTLLLPVWWRLRKAQDIQPFGAVLIDKVLVAYLLLQLILRLEVDSVTNTSRYAFYQFIDVFLPYYVASRTLRNFQQFQEALLCFVLSALLLAPVAIFENLRYWLLYSPLEKALGVDWGFGGYLARDGVLRALATTGQPIVLGYVMAVAIAVYTYFWNLLPRESRLPGLLILIAALIAPLSRGPWVGAVASVACLSIFANKPVLAITRMVLIGGGISILLLISPLGNRVVDYIPFVGNVDVQNIDYRTRLVEVALGVVAQNPLFGSRTAMNSYEMQEMVQGEGIIDLVNSYVAVALSSGYVGLGLFSAVFILSIIFIIRGLLLIADRSSAEYRFSAMLIVSIIGILTSIATVSSILTIPIIYWMFAGFSVSCYRLLSKGKSFAIIGS